MKIRDIHIGDTIVFKDLFLKSHVKGYVFYIDENCNDQSAYFVEVPENLGKNYTETKIHWDDLIPKNLWERLDKNKSYTWVDRSQILSIYSELEELIEDINKELNK